MLDWAVPGDYDGDGHWEPAWYAAGAWETGGTAGTLTYDPTVIDPAQGDWTDWIPVPGNYDATDDAWELAFYDEETATWYIQGQAPVQFGVGSNGVDPSSVPANQAWWDVPVPGDYDGDYDTEIAVYRPADCTFRTQEAGVIATITGGLGFPVAADFDADLADEPAVYDPVQLTWFFGDGSSIAHPPAGGSWFPAPADYDGDDDADPTSWDYDTGTFSAPGATDVVYTDSSPDTNPCSEGPAAITPGLLWSIIRMTYISNECLVTVPADCPPGIPS